MQRTGRPLSELASIMECFPQTLHNVRVKEKKRLSDIPGLDELVTKLESDIKGRGRILIRPSGTEPVIRVMVEGEDETQIKDVARIIGDHIESVCGMC